MDYNESLKIAFEAIKNAENSNKLERERKNESDKIIKSNTAIIEHNKSMISALMKENGVVSDKTDFATFTIKSSPPSVIVRDVDKVPDDFVKVKRDPDKNKIKQFLTDNGSCDWAEWDDYKEILMIKENVK